MSRLIKWRKNFPGLMSDIVSNDSEPIIVGGMSGCGTRLLVWLLEAMDVYMGYHAFMEFNHPPMDSIPLATFLVNTRIAWLSGNLTPDKRMACRLQAAIDLHLAHWNKKRKWGWKNPANMDLINYYHRMFPKMKFIHVVRDGRDVSDEWKQVDVYRSYKALIPTEMLEKNDYEVNYMWLWNRMNRRGVAYGENELGDNYLRVRLEDIIRDTKREGERIRKFIGAKKLDMTKLSTITDPGTIGRHNDMELKELLNAMTEVAKDMLITLGYVKAKEDGE